MGAQQSSGRNGSQGGETVKRCYYEVLGIERTATEDEIKKAYRKKALELHPDRNFGNAEEATAKFAEVQSAHEVLSDPQERAWYDSHRESILRGDSGTVDDHFEHNIQLTTASDIVLLISRFNRNTPFTDEPNGFYGILRETFANIAKEEDSACDWEGLEPIDYPDFGTSKDNYDDVVKPFYRVWINFTTKKTFSWRDVYRTSDAPDRATRRLIEKENKRFREEGIREFNDAVRHLVSFVRKRDPRYVPNSQTESDRQKVLRGIAAAQAARSRAENQAKLNKHIIPEWAQSQKMENEGDFSDSEPEEVEHIECVVCRKTFKSEKQYESHEKSKKHIKAVHQLRREMQLENEALNLDTNAGVAPMSELEELNIASKQAEELDEQKVSSSEIQADGKHEAYHSDADTTTTAAIPEPRVSSDDDSFDEDEDYASRNKVENRIVNSLLEKGIGGALDDSSATVSASESASGAKLGKAKQKQAKKLAKQEIAAQGIQELKCVTCKEIFTSKTKLFDHIKREKHAQPLAPLPKVKKKKK